MDVMAFHGQEVQLVLNRGPRWKEAFSLFFLLIEARNWPIVVAAMPM